MLWVDPGSRRVPNRQRTHRQNDKGKLPNSRLIGQLISRSSLKTRFWETTTHYRVNLPKMRLWGKFPTLIALRTQAACLAAMDHQALLGYSVALSQEIELG